MATMHKMLRLLPLFTLGCGTADIQPLAGTYLTTFTVTDDGCGLFALDGMPEGYTDTEEVDVSFPEGGETVAFAGMVCPLDGNGFVCELQSIDVDMSDMYGTDASYDAIATLLSGIEGTWESADMATGTNFIDMSCEGNGCTDAIADGAAAVCRSEADFTMELID